MRANNVIALIRSVILMDFVPEKLLYKDQCLSIILCAIFIAKLNTNIAYNHAAYSYVYIFKQVKSNCQAHISMPSYKRNQTQKINKRVFFCLLCNQFSRGIFPRRDFIINAESV